MAYTPPSLERDDEYANDISKGGRYYPENDPDKPLRTYSALNRSFGQDSGNSPDEAGGPTTVFILALSHLLVSLEGGNEVLYSNEVGYDFKDPLIEEWDAAL